MDIKFQLIGFKNFERKSDKKPMTIATCITECTSGDNSYGLYGTKAIDFFLPDNLVYSLSVDALGKQFVPVYELNGFGKPALSSYSLK